MILAIQSAIMWTCLALLVLGACVAVLAGIGKSLIEEKRRLGGSAAVMAVCALAAVIYGGGKGTVTVNDPYVVNSGSYLTNDVAHVALAKRTALLPDDTEIMVYARPTDSTNAVDWVRLEPHLTFAQHPYDYPLPNATNYNVMVAANFVPAPTVHTNGVWQIKGFFIPGTGKAAFPNTRTIRKE